MQLSIEKDIEILNEIINSGWLISDLEKCTAIDACEDAITALKQYYILDKIRAEITECSIPDFEYHGCGGSQKIVELEDVLEIIDKYKEGKENG